VAAEQIRFEDGAAYERGMGAWSQLVGREFLDWLAPAPDLSWIDVGCGNGAFSEQLVERCAPAAVLGVDPSQGQIDFARQRSAARLAKFEIGNAMALPFADNSFDAATMALVIFFVPEPAKGLAEMVRVVAPGGTVAAYTWDMAGGGFPLEPIQAELRVAGFSPPRPPTSEVSKIEALQELWTKAGLVDIATRRIDVERHFVDFDDFWGAATLGASVRPLLASMPAEDVERIKTRVRAHLRQHPAGRVSYAAFANAIRGRTPG
jgi:ubiquinone/menaquinone biosynthesis C-methylase UbiE